MNSADMVVREDDV